MSGANNSDSPQPAYSGGVAGLASGAAVGDGPPARRLIPSSVRGIG